MLEGRRGKERLPVERHFGDAQNETVVLHRSLPCRFELPVHLKSSAELEDLVLHVRALARIGGLNAREHLADDNLHVLVRDGGALEVVDLRDLVDHVFLKAFGTGELEELIEVYGTVGDRVALLQRAPDRDDRHAAKRHFVLDLIFLVGTVGRQDDDRLPFHVIFHFRDLALYMREDRCGLRRALVEELFDAREAVGDVAADGGDAAGMEGTHGQLGARFADRLRGDGAHSFAEVDELARGEIGAVAFLADTLFRHARHRRAHMNARHVSCPDLIALLFGKQCAALPGLSARFYVLREDAAGDELAEIDFHP